jgi:uncharacterized RDD family membrane protein YckC
VRAALAPAPVGRRLAAAVVDLALVPLVVVGAAEVGWRSGLLGLVGVSPAGWVAWSWSFARVAWTVAAAALAYHAVCTARWGATPGLRLAGLRVVAHNSDGDDAPLTPWRALWRGAWAAALYLPSVLAVVLAIAGAVTVAVGDRRSPADRVAGTRVVRSGTAPRLG